MNITESTPDDIQELEISELKKLLPKLPGLKKIIATAESRAKELLSDDPDAFDGEWKLKEGATMRTVKDPNLFAQKMLDLQSADGAYPISAEDMMGVATFAIGKCEKLIATRLDCHVKEAKLALEEMGEDIIATTKKAPTLVQCT